MKNKPKPGEWHVVMREDAIRHTVDVRLQVFHKDGSVTALRSDGNFEDVPPGQETPVWLTLSMEHAMLNNFFKIFKFVYVLREEWDHPEEETGKKYNYVVESKGALYGPHRYERARKIQKELEDHGTEAVVRRVYP